MNMQQYIYITRLNIQNYVYGNDENVDNDNNTSTLKMQYRGCKRNARELYIHQNYDVIGDDVCMHFTGILT